MIKNICLLLEVLSILVCLHCLYGEKFKLDIITTSSLTFYMIIITAINYYGWPRISSISVYLVIGLYCGIKFGFKWKKIFINTVLYLAIIGSIQIIAVTCFGYLFNVFFLGYEEGIVVNSVVFLVTAILLPKLKLDKLSHYLQDKERILILSILVCMILTLYGVVRYKVISNAEIYTYIPLFIGIIMFFLLAGRLGKYRIKSKEVETELKMHQLYENSFQSLIEEIRMKQHEFDNHISAIYSLHYTYHTYDELVKAQKEYGQIVIQENRHNKLLTAGNPLIVGFLYGKIIEIEKLDIKVKYKVRIQEMNVNVPCYKLVELIGNLLKNAVEALSISSMSKLLHIELVETDGKFLIEVRNRSDFIQYNEIDSFFKKGYSKKGGSRGLGLYNVKLICTEYSLKISCENKMVDNENWLCFSINN